MTVLFPHLAKRSGVIETSLALLFSLYLSLCPSPRPFSWTSGHYSFGELSIPFGCDVLYRNDRICHPFANYPSIGSSAFSSPLQRYIQWTKLRSQKCIHLLLKSSVFLRRPISIKIGEEFKCSSKRGCIFQIKLKSVKRWLKLPLISPVSCHISTIHLIGYAIAWIHTRQSNFANVFFSYSPGTNFPWFDFLLTFSAYVRPGCGYQRLLPSSGESFEQAERRGRKVSGKIQKPWKVHWWSSGHRISKNLPVDTCSRTYRRDSPLYIHDFGKLYYFPSLSSVNNSVIETAIFFFPPVGIQTLR